MSAKQPANANTSGSTVTADPLRQLAFTGVYVLPQFEELGMANAPMTGSLNPLDVEAKALATLRQFMMRVYCRRLWKDIRQHMARAFGKSWTTKIITIGDAPVHQSAAKGI